MKSLAAAVKQKQNELDRAIHDLCQRIIDKGSGRQAVGGGVTIQLEKGSKGDRSIEYYTYNVEGSDDITGFDIVGIGGTYSFVTTYGGIETCDMNILLDILSSGKPS